MRNNFFEKRKRLFGLLMFLLIFSFTSAVSPAVSPAGLQKDKDKKAKKGKKGNKGANSAAPQRPGTPILWQDPGEVSALDLYWGIGSEEESPKPPFTCEQEDITGTNPKIKVIDANGMKWNVKFDEEVHAEVAASRLAWACGYMVEESYFIPSGKVSGVTGLSRARKFVSSDG